MISPETGNLNKPDQLAKYVPDLAFDRLNEASEVSKTFRFKLTKYYARNVLSGEPDDPLLDIVLPSTEEYQDGEELWDSTPSDHRSSNSPFWIQKYRYQGLMRLTTACSSLCRFCYLKKKNSRFRAMREADVHNLFDDLENCGEVLHEIILSGGDPLCAPTSVLRAIGERMEVFRSRLGHLSPHITIHTREPVWDPVSLLRRRRLWKALDLLKAKVVMLHVLHPREVTPKFLEVCSRLADVAATDRAALLCQHPVFRGVNDSVDTLELLYRKLMTASPPILPYYFVHPFYNGTLDRHRLSLSESQDIYRALIERPGCLVPRLVVPTPWGKCVVGPYEQLMKTAKGYALTTKGGRPVFVG